MNLDQDIEQRVQTHGPKKGERVLIAMSGGVDSAVAAALLKNQGFDVVGIHLQLWDHGGANQMVFGSRCCSISDNQDARRVCDLIGIPYYVINAQAVFMNEVVDYFVHEYLQTRTPNPCAQCNSKIKFNFLFQKADEMGCQYVATGHYAQVVFDQTQANAHLLRAVDPSKDQSYYLFGLTQKALMRTLMPLGGLTKQMVRKLANHFELENADKEDSQEICFIGSEGYKGFIGKRVDPEMIRKGSIYDLEGSVVGEHTGLHRFTIGQRKGLNLARKETEDYYVLGFRPKENILIVGPEKYLFNKIFRASRMNWIQKPEGIKEFDCTAKIRAQHDGSACKVMLFEGGVVHVEFLEGQRAITPGQSVVFYRDDEILGGGFIDQVLDEARFKLDEAS